MIPGLGTKILHASGHQSTHKATAEHVCPRAHDQKQDDVTAARSLCTATRESPRVASKIKIESIEVMLSQCGVGEDF